MTDRATRQAIVEAIRSDMHARVDGIMERFVKRASGSGQGSVAPEALDEALAEVSDVLAEGIAAQLRESGQLGRGPGSH